MPSFKYQSSLELPFFQTLDSCWIQLDLSCNHRSSMTASPISQYYEVKGHTTVIEPGDLVYNDCLGQDLCRFGLSYVLTDRTEWQPNQLVSIDKAQMFEAASSLHRLRTCGLYWTGVMTKTVRHTDKFKPIPELKCQVEDILQAKFVSQSERFLLSKLKSWTKYFIEPSYDLRYCWLSKGGEVKPPSLTLLLVKQHAIVALQLLQVYESQVWELRSSYRCDHYVEWSPWSFLLATKYILLAGNDVCINLCQ